MEKIRDYVEELFIEAPKTKRARDLKEELISNLSDKYNDLIEDGKKSSDAYKEVIASIGNIDELLADLAKSDKNQDFAINEQKKKTALVVTISVALYIISLIVIAVLSEIGVEDYVVMSVFFGIAGLATCLLIYHFMSQPKYQKVDATLVEDFKEWKSNRDQNKAVKNSVHSIIWLLIVIVYFIVSFVFGIWYISWIIFLIGVVIQNIVDLLFFGGNK